MRPDRVRDVAGVALGFAAGCLPSARLVARLAHGSQIEALGDGKPGAANVYRSLGARAGATVLALDGLKAFAPAAALKAAGAPQGVVAAAAAAPVAAHVAVVGGQGAGAALGAAFVIDAPATVVALVPILGGAKLGYNPQGVLAGAFLFPIASGVRHRSWSAALRAATLPAIMITARLRGRPGAGRPHSLRVALNRFLLDRDE